VLQWDPEAKNHLVVGDTHSNVASMLPRARPAVDVDAEVEIDPCFVRVRRGPADLDPETFDVSQSYLERPVALLDAGLRPATSE
jgi:hypothetical protein